KRHLVRVKSHDLHFMVLLRQTDRIRDADPADGIRVEDALDRWKLLQNICSCVARNYAVPVAVLDGDKTHLRKFLRDRISESIRSLLMIELVRQRDNPYIAALPYQGCHR